MGIIRRFGFNLLATLLVLASLLSCGSRGEENSMPVETGGVEEKVVTDVEKQKIPEGIYHRDDFEALFLGKPMKFVMKRLGKESRVTTKGYPPKTVLVYSEKTYKLKGNPSHLDANVHIIFGYKNEQVIEIEYNR